MCDCACNDKLDRRVSYSISGYRDVYCWTVYIDGEAVESDMSTWRWVAKRTAKSRVREYA
jgi:hypothetical protein